MKKKKKLKKKKLKKKNLCTDPDCPAPDKNTDNCGGWATSGECDENPNYMLVHCATSCAEAGALGYTTLEEAEAEAAAAAAAAAELEARVSENPDAPLRPDENIHCASWANIGECDNNPNYMLVHCATSCKNVGSLGYAIVE